MLAVFENLYPKNSIYNIYDNLNNKINYPKDTI